VCVAIAVLYSGQDYEFHRNMNLGLNVREDMVKNNGLLLKTSRLTFSLKLNSFFFFNLILDLSISPLSHRFKFLF
jgi:hypothetical protein